MKITVWNEFRHERENDDIRALYPNGMHACIADFLKKAGNEVTLAALDDPECGLSENILNETDVLFWWGHLHHMDVPDEIVQKVYERVMNGMGLVCLHSAHNSKIFKKLVGTNAGKLKWRESDDREILWNVAPGHPITRGIGDRIDIEHEETYGEHFMIPTPDELIFISWFSGGEVFRSGCVFNRGLGKIFYFRPGHEAVPTYYHPDVQRVLINAAEYVCPKKLEKNLTYGHIQRSLDTTDNCIPF